MIIRPINIDTDALAMLDGAVDCIERQGFNELLPTSLLELQACLGRVLSLKEVDVFVAEEQDKILAGIGLCTTPYIWNPKILLSDELFWWAAPKAPWYVALELFAHALNYCKLIGSKPVFKALVSREELKKHFERAGLRPVEIMYIG